MDYRNPPDVEELRQEVRAVLVEAMSSAHEHADPDDLTGLDERFERALHKACGARGWLGMTVDEGGDGDGHRSVAHQAAFNFEVAAAGAPLIDTAMTLAGQPIVEYGSPAQQEFFLPRMLRGDIEMCIAYTEEQAGSDLAAVATTADASGDDFVLNGTKVMITGAHKADWCCTVARTQRDGAARDAMTMFLVDMTTPGVSVVRRPTMNGWTLDEIHFHDAQVGPDAVLGERDRGWSQLLSAVAAERSSSFYLGFANDVLQQLIAHVRHTTRDGVPLVDDPLVRDQIAALHIGLEAGIRLATRTTWTHEQGEPNTVLSSMTKVYATELLQRLAQVATEIAGHAGAIRGPLFGPSSPYAAAGGRFAWEYLERVHGTISVGANELQRDTIAHLGLGLPRPGRS